MAEPVTCPGCQARIKVRDEHAGKRVKCPKCGGAVPVPAFDDEDDAPERAAVTAAPPGRRGEGPRMGGVRKAMRTDPEAEPDEDAPVRKKGFVPCPRCGAEDPKKVKWTPWGSFYGPAMFHHVRCRECGYRYNGRSGRSNLIPAIICITIPTVLIAGIVGFIGFMLYAYFTSLNSQ
jgi:predicted Zn finger-like uncharacterized protein